MRAFWPAFSIRNLEVIQKERNEEEVLSIIYEERLQEFTNCKLRKCTSD